MPESGYDSLHSPLETQQVCTVDNLKVWRDRLCIAKGVAVVAAVVVVIGVAALSIGASAPFGGPRFAASHEDVAELVLIDDQTDDTNGIVSIDTVGEDCPEGYRPMSEEECWNYPTIKGKEYDFGAAGCPVEWWPAKGCFRWKDHVYYSTCEERNRTTIHDGALHHGICVNATVVDTSPTVDAISPEGPKPTLFCWLHMMVGGVEEQLVRLQVGLGGGIFACNHFAVVSTEEVNLGNISGKPVETLVSKSSWAGHGQLGVNGVTTRSWLNTHSFILSWDLLFKRGELWSYDFVIKADPDAVLFPSRLRPHVQAQVGEAVYFLNCHGGMWGSLEVFSTPALRRYSQRSHICKALPWQNKWGEDYYIQRCLEHLGVGTASIDGTIADPHCHPASCWDRSKVAYHWFKSPDVWQNCFREAGGHTGGHIRR